MVTKPIRFVQIAATTDHIFGLDEEGNVFYREKPPFKFGGNTYQGGYQKQDEAEEKKVWKKCFMEYKVELPKGGAERDAQPAPEEGETGTAIEVEVDEGPHKIYKDPETVKKVQQALKDKGIYLEKYKVDGDLGHLTTKAIKEYQKSVNLKETGEIDLQLWTSLGLNSSAGENETIIQLNEKDVEEHTDVEVFCGA